MLVTVYLPTKNRREQLERAVASVLGQSYPELELIVVNDGSTDDTRAWLDALAAADPRVRAIHHDTSVGAPRSRNEAIRAARGAWITGLDDDDAFKPHRVELMLEYARMLERSGTAFSVIYSQEEIITSHGTRMSSKKPSAVHEDLFSGNVVGNQVFARKHAYLEAGMYDEDLPAWQDLDFAMRVTHRFGPARLFDAPLYVFADDERPDRISRKKKDKLLTAYSIVSAKWPQAPSALRQCLYLQLMSPYYLFRIEPSDLWRYFSLGVSPTSIYKLLRTLRNRKRLAA